MIRPTHHLFATLALASLALVPSAALARGGSFTPLGGQLPATAPGGTEGLAGPRNVSDAVRSGHAYPRRAPAYPAPYPYRSYPNGYGAPRY